MKTWDAYGKDFKKIPDIELVRGKDIPTGSWIKYSLIKLMRHCF